MHKPLAVRPAEAAAMIGISRSRIYQLMETGQLPSFRLGRVRLIKVEALEQLLKDVEVEGLRGGDR